MAYDSPSANLICCLDSLDGERLQMGEGNIGWVHFFQVAKDYCGTMIPKIWRDRQHGVACFMLVIQRLSEAAFVVQKAG